MVTDKYFDKIEQYIAELMIDFTFEIKNPLTISDYMVDEFYQFMLNDLRLTFKIEEGANERLHYVSTKVLEVLETKESYEHAHVIMKLQKRIHECQNLD